jgi:hypothetical protein
VRWRGDRRRGDRGGIQTLALTESEHVYDAGQLRLVLTIADGLENIRVLGIQSSDGSRPLDRCKPSVQAYVAQAFGPGPYTWLANPLG